MRFHLQQKLAGDCGVAFGPFCHSTLRNSQELIDVSLDVFFMADIVVSFLTSYEYQVRSHAALDLSGRAESSSSLYRALSLRTPCEMLAHR